MLMVIIIGVAWYAKNPNVTESNSLYVHNSNKTDQESIDRQTRISSEQDDDGDGLMNWEEVLWGTDPKNPDTDGDGVSDGDEVRLGRNPLVPGPGDTTTGLTNAGSDIVDNSKTAQISRDLFSNYLQTKRIGVPVDASVQDQIINRVFSGESPGIQNKEYTLADITISANSDFKKYGNDIGLALSRGRAQDNRTELDILRAALAQENRLEIQKLDPIIAGYETILNGVAATQVPRDLIGQHIELLNSLSRVLANIKSFRLIFDDPVVGLAGLSNYYHDVDYMQRSFQNIKFFMQSNNISFEQGEHGYVLFNTI